MLYQTVHFVNAVLYSCIYRAHKINVLCIFFLHVACRANEYIDPSSSPGLPICIPCPLNSVSAGGDAIICSCNDGTGRINESDVTLPCLGEYVKVPAG